MDRMVEGSKSEFQFERFDQSELDLKVTDLRAMAQFRCQQAQYQSMHSLRIPQFSMGEESLLSRIS